jgi:PST family polysaccharide transporter
MGLREKSIRGGAVLVLRDVVGTVVRSAGIVVIIAAIGPGSFGRYAGAWAISYAVAIVAQLGTEVYLVRRDDLDERHLATATTLLIVTSALSLAVCGVASVVALRLGIGRQSVLVFAALALAIPINILWAPAQAVLERDLRFTALAALELGGDLVLYGVAVPAALVGAGVWSLVAGVFVWQLFLLVGSFAIAKVRFQWRWDGPELRAQLGFGLRYAVFTWAQRARDLVNPLVVGPIGGAAMVGQVALTIRLLESLSFVYRAAWRLSLSAIAHMRNDMERVRRGVHESILLKVLVVGFCLDVAALVIDPVVPRVLGTEWDGAVRVFPLLALAMLLSAVGTTASVVLVSFDRMRAAVASDVARLAIVAGVAAVAVTRFDERGFGIAEVAGCVTFVGAFMAAPSRPSFRLREVAPWLVAFAVPLFAPEVAPPVRPLLLVPLVGCALMPATNRTVRSVARAVVRSFRRERAPIRAPRVIVTAWTKRPRRSEELAAELGGTCKVFRLRRLNSRPLVPLRYLVHSIQTVVYLTWHRPDVVIVTSPPVPAAAVVTAWGRVLRRRVVIDSHPASFGAQGDTVSARLQPLQRWAVRHAHAALVTTEDWARVVRELGGTGLVVHEPPPTGQPKEPRPSTPRRPTALYVNIFAPDEPIDEVVEAARLLPHVDVLITGDPGQCPSAIRDKAPANARFVGYLHGRAYDDALHAADVVIALTDEPTSLMRAAYHAVNARRPLVVTDWPTLAEVFPFAQRCSHDPTDLAAAVARALLTEPAECERAEAAQRDRWRRQRNALVGVIARTDSDVASTRVEEMAR